MPRKSTKPKLAVDAAVYTIKEFCAAYRISESFYFKLKQEGKGPREIKLGKRKLIRIDDARAWALTMARD